jgi:hypothetical protein
MTDITLSTTVAELVTAGLIESPQALERLLKKPMPKAKRQISEADQAEHEMLCEQILSTIDDAKSGIKWKTGRLNLCFFTIVKR